MKVVKLVSENVKRLHAVEITPDGNVITIGGKNGAGKSSVLDSIAMALGGANLVPVEPIHAGETEAKVEVDLGEYVVIRKFKRDVTVIHGSAFITGEPINGVYEYAQHACDETCTRTYGPTRSTLTVKSKDGATYPSPQSLLDKITGTLSFDPLAFSRLDPKAQDSLLRKLVGLDTSFLDQQRIDKAAARATIKRQVTTSEAQVKMLPVHPSTPTTPVDIKELMDERARAVELQTRATEAARAVQATEGRLDGLREDVALIQERIDRLEQELVEARTRKAAAEDAVAGMSMTLTGHRAQAKAALEAVPSIEVIDKRILDTKAVNERVLANTRHKDAMAALNQLKAQLSDTDAAVKALDAQKASMLSAVEFPVPGLGFGENGITFNGVPFEQASTAEQLRVSVAIGLALNPKLKVLLIRDGNHLDEDSLKLVADMALQADAQVWMEWVTKSKEGVTVLIEDGEVVR